MGCFNSICNVSGLPIYQGDKVRLFLLHNQDIDRTILPLTSQCYANEISNPLALPITGFYNDYGNITAICDSKSTIVMDYPTRSLNDHLQAQLDAPGGLFVLDKQNERLDRHDSFTSERLQQMRNAHFVVTSLYDIDSKKTALENILNARDIYMGPQQRPVLFTLVHNDMYLSLGKIYFGRKYNKLRKLITNELDAYFAALVTFLPEMQNIQQKAALVPWDERSETQRMSAFWIMECEKWGYVSSGSVPDMSAFFTRDQVDKESFALYGKILCDGIRSGWNNKNAEWRQLRKSLIDFSLFIRAFQGMNKTWMPLRTGGQGYDLTQHAINLRFAKAILEHSYSCYEKRAR